MNKLYLKDKIELKFFEDDKLDLTLLELINKNSFKRGRQYFIKDILKKYFIELDKENEKSLIERKQKLKQEGEKEALKSAKRRRNVNNSTSASCKRRQPTRASEIIDKYRNIK
ncbi:hypothetical protein SAMN02745134_00830 [Clostridium acidisoli DSM 12555]|uniref:Uncharacterized protein n=1 Tax=Clostridium acidisoli DSM 12555 TaxID=1121291 RepID=A0A1W1X680_9CLOT|nr:hypothetical protein [Clostridium acidisoli]SMC19435.1 hypothetical protein SAMN02745134_00830 [Clostridium acidisoli DSM 12555]